MMINYLQKRSKNKCEVKDVLHSILYLLLLHQAAKLSPALVPMFRLKQQHFGRKHLGFRHRQQHYGLSMENLGATALSNAMK
jgi:tRNA G26 N,N-dimethylase Trm1